MTVAVSQWEDELRKPESLRMSMTVFADRHEIKLPTFSKLVSTVDGKRVEVGCGQVRNPSLTKTVNSSFRTFSSGEIGVTKD